MHENRKGGTMNKTKDYSVIICCCIFIICVLARVVEYFFIRTDETILAENFLHKAFGIALLFAVLIITKKRWKDIGFARKGIIPGFLKGILLAGGCFSVAYGVECFLLYMTHHNAALSFYATGFSLNGTMEQHTGLLFVLMCVGLNLINVWMEEGIFRGLFTNILKEWSYMKSVLLIAFLFGIWHLVMPLRDYIEGNSSMANLLVMGIGYIILAGIMSVKWSFLYKLTGSLWMGIGDHLFNNVIVTNLVHVVSNGEADSMQIVRILLGQLLSFAIVCVIFRKKTIEAE